MVKITYIEHNGTPHTVDVEPGYTVMEGAVMNAIPGIDALCGGACACATCHVYVAEDWYPHLGRHEHIENDTLQFASNVKANSRLSCQIRVTPALDGLVVRMPERQS